MKCALVDKQRLPRDRYLQMVDLCTRVRQLQLDDKGTRVLGDRYLETMDLCSGVRQLHLDVQCTRVRQLLDEDKWLELGVRQFQVEDQDLDKNNLDTKM